MYKISFTSFLAVFTRHGGKQTSLHYLKKRGKVAKSLLKKGYLTAESYISLENKAKDTRVTFKLES